MVFVGLQEHGGGRAGIVAQMLALSVDLKHPLECRSSMIPKAHNIGWRKWLGCKVVAIQWWWQLKRKWQINEVRPKCTLDERTVFCIGAV